MIDLDKVNRIYFIGIGGIMMSAVAKYFNAQGKSVAGSDREPGQIIDGLYKKSIQVNIGHKAENISDEIDLVVYTQAIDKDNSELLKAKELKIPSHPVYEVLGELSKHKYSIAISGMHGKSTVTAMLGLVMEKAALDPAVFVGTQIKEWQSNFRAGKSKYLLSEACEYKDNFLNFHPDILVINNLEAEHLDYFKDLNGVKKSFEKLIGQIKQGGWLILNGDDKNLVELLEKLDKLEMLKVIKFAIDAGVDFKAKNVKMNKKGEMEFVLKSTNEKYNGIKFSQKILGEFNVYNALAVIAVSAVLGIKVEKVKEVLEKFSGAWRRFEFKGVKNGIEYYDDYAHHPTEIKATLKAVKKKLENPPASLKGLRRARKLWLIYQPHLYSRTNDFLNEFAKVLNSADHLILAPIYAAREENQWGIESSDLVKLINKKYKRKNPAVYLESFGKIKDYLKQNVKSGDVVMTMGAGDVWKMSETSKLSESSKLSRVFEGTDLQSGP